MHHSGFFRVNYDDTNWNLLIKQLTDDHKKIHEINRATLIDDSFNLGRAGSIEQTTYLKLVKYLEKEEDPIPWSATFEGMKYIGDMLSACNNGTLKAFKVS